MRLVVADTSPLRYLVRRGIVDLADALARLRTTNFRRREELFDALLKHLDDVTTPESASRSHGGGFLSNDTSRREPSVGNGT